MVPTVIGSGGGREVLCGHDPDVNMNTDSFFLSVNKSRFSISSGLGIGSVRRLLSKGSAPQDSIKMEDIDQNTQ